LPLIKTRSFTVDLQGQVRTDKDAGHAPDAGLLVYYPGRVVSLDVTFVGELEDTRFAKLYAESASLAEVPAHPDLENPGCPVH
jgi:hypothetical protein